MCRFLPFSRDAVLPGGSQPGQVGVESDPGDLRPETQGFRTASPAGPTVGGGAWLCLSRLALPEQMGACQCCGPGTGLTSSHCQVAGDSGAWRGTCVWFGCLLGEVSPG